MREGCDWTVIGQRGLGMEGDFGAGIGKRGVGRVGKCRAEIGEK